jgi:cation transport ATPase
VSRLKKPLLQHPVALGLAIEEMSCGACAAKIQRQVSTLPEVEDVTVKSTSARRRYTVFPTHLETLPLTLSSYCDSAVLPPTC